MPSTSWSITSGSSQNASGNPPTSTARRATTTRARRSWARSSDRRYTSPTWLWASISCAALGGGSRRPDVVRGDVTRTRSVIERLPRPAAWSSGGGTGSVAADEEVAQGAGVAAADGQLGPGDDHGAPAGLGAYLVDVRQRDEQRAVDADEPGRLPLLLQRREG